MLDILFWKQFSNNYLSDKSKLIINLLHIKNIGNYTIVIIFYYKYRYIYININKYYNINFIIIEI